MDLRNLLESVLKDEKDASVKEAFGKAIEVLDGGDAETLQGVARKVTGSNRPRERV